MSAPSPAPGVVEPGEQPWGWHLYRVSGLALAVLLPVVVVTGLLTTDVADWSAEAVADRWDDPLWRVVDWSFLVLALVHGGIGLDRLARAGLRAPGRARVATTLITVVLVALGLAVTGVVFTYEL